MTASLAHAKLISRLGICKLYKLPEQALGWFPLGLITENDLLNNVYSTTKSVQLHVAKVNRLAIIFLGSVSAPFCRPPLSDHMTSPYSSTSSCSSSTAQLPTQHSSLISLTLKSSQPSLNSEALHTQRTLHWLSLMSVQKRYMYHIHRHTHYVKCF